MKIYVKNTLSGLIPLYNSDFEEKKKLKIGVEYLCDIKKPRNYDYHKRFFAMLNIGWQNTRFENINFEAYRSYVIMKSGYYDSFETNSGIMILPQSMSFANMDQSEFERLNNAAIDVIIRDIGVSREELLQEILNFL